MQGYTQYDHIGNVIGLNAEHDNDNVKKSVHKFQYELNSLMAWFSKIFPKQISYFKNILNAFIWMSTLGLSHQYVHTAWIKSVRFI